jgi:F0F1-type ATP synthase alpha subunit
VVGQPDASCVKLGDLALKKPSRRRQLVNRQLYTGHLRIDMANPISKGNFVILKGDRRASGKNLVVQGAINSHI